LHYRFFITNAEKATFSGIILAVSSKIDNEVTLIIDFPVPCDLLQELSISFYCFSAVFSEIAPIRGKFLAGISYLILHIIRLRKIIEFTRVPRLRASPRHGGAWTFFLW